MAAVTASRAQFLPTSPWGQKEPRTFRIANIREMVPGSQQRGQDANRCRLTFIGALFRQIRLGATSIAKSCDSFWRVQQSREKTFRWF
jgi:hypothetical protein